MLPTTSDESNRPDEPIPTEYRGITYRSKLEATWAAFFYLMGWFVEYETLRGWYYIPDFIVNQGWQLTIEVKNESSTADLSQHENKVHRGMNGGDDDIILVGSRPTIRINDKRCKSRLYTTGISTEYGHFCGLWDLYFMKPTREYFLLSHCLPQEFRNVPELKRMTVREIFHYWKIAIANVERDGTRALKAPPTIFDAKQRIEKQQPRPRKISGGDDQNNPA